MNCLVILVVLYALFTFAIGDFRNDSLALHNRYRVKHHSPTLTQNKTLNDYAKKWAQTMANSNNMIHSGGKYGENIYMSTDIKMSNSDAAKKATESWYNEVSKYNYYKPGFSMATGHFTQVVWKNSKNVGVRVARSANGVYVCANYDPRGNYEGQFPQNVLKP